MSGRPGGARAGIDEAEAVASPTSAPVLALRRPRLAQAEARRQWWLGVPPLCTGMGAAPGVESPYPARGAVRFAPPCRESTPWRPARMAARRHLMPLILAALLLVSAVVAIARGSRADWVMVALVAITLALDLWHRGHTNQK